MEATEAAQTQEFFPVHLAVMQPGTVAPVDLYIKPARAAAHTLYKAAQTPLDMDVRDRLLDRGVSRLFLRKKDERAYRAYVEENITRMICDDLLPMEEACVLVYESSANIMDDVFRDPRAGRNMQRAYNVVEATVTSILKDPAALWHMTGVAASDYQTYTHCVNVSMFLVGACQRVLGVDDPQTLKRIGTGAIFHDVGKSQIDREVLEKHPAKLTRDEAHAIRMHPAAGLELVEGHGEVSPTTASIIRWHHECMDGTGYPDGLSGERLGKVVRLAAIADVYDTLTTDRPHEPAMSAFEALQVMSTDMKGRLDPSLLQLFIQFLGPTKANVNVRSSVSDVAARLRKD